MNVELENVVKRVNICICCVLNVFASCMLFVLHFNALIFNTSYTKQLTLGTCTDIFPLNSILIITG